MVHDLVGGFEGFNFLGYLTNHDNRTHIIGQFLSAYRYNQLPINTPSQLQEIITRLYSYIYSIINN